MTSATTDAIKLYNKNLSAALTAQIHTAINAFLSALEDADFDLASNVTLRAMLMHLRAKYGNLTSEELEKNHMELSEPWNFDDPIKDCWAKTA